MWKIAIAALALSACAESTLEGTYEGKATTPGAELPPTWKLTITKQTPITDGDAPPAEGNPTLAAVEGTWAVTGIMIDASGAVSGTFTDPNLTLTFTSATAEHCGYNITATWKGDDIDGHYAAMQCFVVAEGTFSLSRQ